MLGSRSNSGWGVCGEMHHSLCSEFVDMVGNCTTTRNVWGGEEAFLSPPEFNGPSAISADSEESSEDHEDYISGLAEELAQTMLQEEEREAAGEALLKSGAWSVAPPKPAWGRGYTTGSSPTSPQPTLAGFNWETRSNKGSSGVPSPPSPQEGEALVALYGELLRAKLEDQSKLANQRRHMLSLQQQIIRRPPLSTTTVERLSPAICRSMPTNKSCKSHGAGDNVLSLAIDRAMMARQGRQLSSKGSSREAGGGCKEVEAGWGGAAAQQPQQGKRGRRKGGEEPQQSHFSLYASNVGGAGGGGGGGPMRAVFLGAPASRECGGTGVFLPRRLGSTHHHHHHPDSKRKPVCSTVLLPAHIVQALNLNVEDTFPHSQYRRGGGGDGISSSHRYHHLYTCPAESHRVESKEDGFFPMSKHSPTLQEVAPNISLPSEWTY